MTVKAPLVPEERSQHRVDLDFERTKAKVDAEYQCRGLIETTPISEDIAWGASGPADPFTPVCTAYQIIRPILRELEGIHFFPANWKNAISDFTKLMDAVCPSASAPAADLSEEAVSSQIEQALATYWRTREGQEVAIAVEPGMTSQICGAYRAVRPILDFATRFVPRLWEHGIDVAEEVFDSICGMRDPDPPTVAQVLDQLVRAAPNIPAPLICLAELTRFDERQRAELSPLLWQYILNHRNGDDQDELVALGSAIRKYISIMPMERMGELTVLLEPSPWNQWQQELTLEVAKMVYRNFEALPPAGPDPQPELACRLLEIARNCMRPDDLLVDKHAAIASLAIEAIVAMRGDQAAAAWRAAVECQHRWFGEMVTDGLDELRGRWVDRDGGAVQWLDDLRRRILGLNGESRGCMAL